MDRMKKTNTATADSEVYSVHLGVRMTPADLVRIRKYSKQYNLRPSVFIRQLILNKLDELSKAKK